MIRAIRIEDIPLINNLINDKNYVIDEYELNKSAKVFIENDKIIAFISYNIFFERAELNYIFVDKNERRKGIASLLIEDMIVECMKKNVNTIDLEVSSLNKNAIKLYEKYKFKKVSVRKKYYNGVDALLMMMEVKK